MLVLKETCVIDIFKMIKLRIEYKYFSYLKCFQTPQVMKHRSNNKHFLNHLSWIFKGSQLLEIN